MLPRTEIDGHAPSAEELLPAALVSYGHITVMQVRNGAVRGLDLHLSRLDGANRELYGAGLDGDLLRHRIRRALDDVGDATVRLTIFQRESDVFREEPDVSIMVTVRPPAEAPGSGMGLRSVVYQRPVAHIKHTGSFGQIHYGRLAVREGFDDALLVDQEGRVSEAAIANILCHDGGTFLWPDAPALPGITMLLLNRAGLTAPRRTINRTDLPSCAAVFVTNSSGISPVTRVDDQQIPYDPELTKQLTSLYESIPWDPI